MVSQSDRKAKKLESLIPEGQFPDFVEAVKKVRRLKERRDLAIHSFYTTDGGTLRRHRTRGRTPDVTITDLIQLRDDTQDLLIRLEAGVQDISRCWPLCASGGTSTSTGSATWQTRVARRLWCCSAKGTDVWWIPQPSSTTQKPRTQLRRSLSFSQPTATSSCDFAMAGRSQAGTRAGETFWSKCARSRQTRSAASGVERTAWSSSSLTRQNGGRRPGLRIA